MKSNRFRNFMIKITTLILVLFGLAVGARLGFFSKENIDQVRNSRIIELPEQLPSLPNLNLAGKNHADPSTASGCRVNLNLIQNAKNRALKKEHSAVGTPAWSDVNPYLSGNVSCPGGGAYQLNNYQSKPTCSVGGNGTVDRADNHQI